jgi:hypothetical protein
LKPGPPRTTLVFVDAVEGPRARLLVETEAFDVPAALLPAGAGEGTWLRLRFGLVADPTGAASVRRRLGSSDDGRDLAL